MISQMAWPEFHLILMCEKGIFNLYLFLVNLHIRTECRKIRTRKIPNTDTFYAVNTIDKLSFMVHPTYSTFTCSKSTTETPEQLANSVQSLYC